MFTWDISKMYQSNVEFICLSLCIDERGNKGNKPMSICYNVKTNWRRQSKWFNTCLVFDAKQPLSDTHASDICNIWIETILKSIVYFIFAVMVMLISVASSSISRAVLVNRLILIHSKQICSKHLKRHFIQPNFKSIKLYLSVNHLMYRKWWEHIYIERCLRQSFPTNDSRHPYEHADSIGVELRSCTVHVHFTYVFFIII